MIPLRDNIPTARFPILTVVLIALNVAAFAWQVTLPSDRASSPQLAALGVPESDEAVLELGAIPYRLTHPGKGCALTAAVEPRPGERADVVCEGTPRYREAEALAAQGAAPLIPLDDTPWWVTILTSMFLHGGILHIAGNMLFLWVFGNNVEDSMGRPRFLAFYLLAGIVAAYAQALLDPGATVPAIGASGAVAGVLGGYALLHPDARVLTLVFIVFFVTFVEIPALLLLGIWFLLQFLPAITQVTVPEVAGEQGIAYLAHVGGFLFGLAAIKLFAMRRAEAPPPYPVY